MEKCSLIFAYVHLCSLNGRKIVERKPNGERPEATEGKEVTEDVQEGRRKNAECRMKSWAHGHGWGMQNARQTDHGGSRFKAN